MNIERLSLDQLRVLVLVADTGSFAGAARRLNRVQSAISYTIQQLELQLGVELFDRSGKRPVLSAAGRSIVEDARLILARADSLIARAGALAAGLESEVSLTVDVMVPFDRFARLLRDFEAEYPTVRVRLQVQALGGVVAQVRDRVADIGLICSLLEPPDDLVVQGISSVVLVPVVAPSHPLADGRGPVPPDRLAEYTQIVLSDPTDLTAGKDYSVFSPRTWRVSDLAAKHALLREGLGFGHMPTHLVGDDLAAGRLVQLEVDANPRDGIHLPIYTAHRADQGPGRALRWLLMRLKDLDATCPAN